MLWLYTQTGTFDLPALHALALSHSISSNPHALLVCSLVFLVAFAVKVPVFPLHGWLQEAVSEAPTAAVMVLAGKLGLYSILRFSFGIFPEQSHAFAPWLIAAGAIGIAYGSLIALIKTDLKKLAAFSTLAHVSFVVLGIFTFTVLGVDGGIFQILNESLIGAALFVLLGLLYERYGTYEIRDYGGLATRHPWMVTMFVITTLAAVGLPMLNGFVGEFLILSGTMQSVFAHHIAWTVVAKEVTGWDLTAREHFELWPLAALFIILGLASPIFMKAIDTYGAATAGKVIEIAPGWYKNIETSTYSVNNAEINAYCQSHPCHFRMEARVVPNKEVR
jgi:NADH-quinone oxidoreductase subunit M